MGVVCIDNSAWCVHQVVAHHYYSVKNGPDLLILPQYASATYYLVLPVIGDQLLGSTKMFISVVRSSTIGEGGDTTISSPGRSPKQPLPGIGLHDPLHSRQACPEFVTFDQGVGQICSR